MSRAQILRSIGLMSLFWLFSSPALAGYCVLSVNDIPDYAIAGKPLTVVFTIYVYDGVASDSFQPTALAAISGSAVKADIAPGPQRGQYTATLTLPRPGEWTITINPESGLNSVSSMRLTLEALSPGSPLPAALAELSRGQRLFSIKGCVYCHHETQPDGSSDTRLDLFGKRLPEDYVRTVLGNPGVKLSYMPKFQLKPDETDALVAFIDRKSVV